MHKTVPPLASLTSNSLLANLAVSGPIKGRGLVPTKSAVPSLFTSRALLIPHYLLFNFGSVLGHSSTSSTHSRFPLIHLYTSYFINVVQMFLLTASFIIYTTHNLFLVLLLAHLLVVIFSLIFSTPTHHPTLNTRLLIFLFFVITLVFLPYYLLYNFVSILVHCPFSSKVSKYFYLLLYLSHSSPLPA